MKLKPLFQIFIKGILAGIAIGIGGIIFLKTKEQTGLVVLPALLFPIGLILICNFDFYLYTGKICYLPSSISQKTTLGTIVKLVIGLIGNLLGTTILGIILHQVIPPTTLVEKMLEVKINYEWWQLIVLGICCGGLIYFAVEGYQKINNNLGKYIVLICCISGFIICGFEHCIADMFYFAYALSFNIDTLTTILLVIVGNSIGGILLYLLTTLSSKLK